jgi:hypothetical protein
MTLPQSARGCPLFSDAASVEKFNQRLVAKKKAAVGPLSFSFVPPPPYSGVLKLYKLFITGPEFCRPGAWLNAAQSITL